MNILLFKVIFSICCFALPNCINKKTNNKQFFYNIKRSALKNNVFTAEQNSDEKLDPYINNWFNKMKQWLNLYYFPIQMTNDINNLTSYTTNSVIFGNEQINKTLLDSTSLYSWVAGEKCQCFDEKQVQCRENVFKCSKISECLIYPKQFQPLIFNQTEKFVPTGGGILKNPALFTGLKVNSSISFIKTIALSNLFISNLTLISKEEDFYYATQIYYYSKLTGDAILSLANTKNNIIFKIIKQQDYKTNEFLFVFSFFYFPSQEQQKINQKIYVQQLQSRNENQNEILKQNQQHGIFILGQPAPLNNNVYTNYSLINVGIQWQSNILFLNFIILYIVALQSFKILNSNYQTPFQQNSIVTFDTTLNGYGLAPQQLNIIKAQINSTLMHSCRDKIIIICNCKTISDLPVLIFGLQSSTRLYNIFPQFYAKYEANQCSINLFNTGIDGQYAFGIPFFKQYYTVFDLQNQLISISNLNTSEFSKQFFSNLRDLDLKLDKIQVQIIQIILILFIPFFIYNL